MGFRRSERHSERSFSGICIPNILEWVEIGILRAVSEDSKQINGKESGRTAHQCESGEWSD
jgi:hypothetical protein